MRLFIPFGSVYSYYKQAEALKSVTDSSINKWIVFLTWFAFSPDVRFIVQTELNKRATQKDRIGSPARVHEPLSS